MSVRAAWDVVCDVTGDGCYFSTNEQFVDKLDALNHARRHGWRTKLHRSTRKMINVCPRCLRDAEKHDLYVSPMSKLSTP